MWTAIALWCATLAGVAAYVGWAASRVAQGLPAWPFVIGAPLVYFAVFAFCLAVELALAWFARARRPPEARIGAGAALRLVRDEYRALVGSLWRMMAYRQLVTDPAPAAATQPVLLLHGVLCNAGVFSPMLRHLAERGVGPAYTLSYGPPRAPIERFVAQLAARIDAVLATTGAAQVTLVAHSMGGLVALAYCRAHGPAKIRRIVTLGTPYRGSFHAWLFPGACLAQMRPGNAWLAALHAARFARPPLHSIWSWHDTMVTPQTSACLDASDSTALKGVGHNALLTDATARARVVDLLAGAPAPAAGPRTTSGYPG
jgi:pimeloyl-ACP methyl ester carboxylesterase